MSAELKVLHRGDEEAKVEAGSQAEAELLAIGFEAAAVKEEAPKKPKGKKDE